MWVHIGEEGRTKGIRGLLPPLSHTVPHVWGTVGDMEDIVTQWYVDSCRGGGGGDEGDKGDGVPLIPHRLREIYG